MLKTLTCKTSSSLSGQLGPLRLLVGDRFVFWQASICFFDRLLFVVFVVITISWGTWLHENTKSQLARLLSGGKSWRWLQLSSVQVGSWWATLRASDSDHQCCDGDDQYHHDIIMMPVIKRRWESHPQSKWQWWRWCCDGDDQYHDGDDIDAGD